MIISQLELGPPVISRKFDLNRNIYMQLKIQSSIGDNELKKNIYISFESDLSRSSPIEVTSPTVSDRTGAHEKITA